MEVFAYSPAPALNYLVSVFLTFVPIDYKFFLFKIKIFFYINILI